MGETYADRWNYKQSALGFGGLPTEFVACEEAVLPTSASPFLSFCRPAQQQPVSDAYGIPSDWPSADRQRLSAYRMIGSDGAGNPLCIKEGSGAVVLLDHEDRFRERQFVNSGVNRLAECLLAHMGENEPERFRAAVFDIDPPALAEWSFWWREAIGLAEDAESDDADGGSL